MLFNKENSCNLTTKLVNKVKNKFLNNNCLTHNYIFYKYLIITQKYSQICFLIPKATFK